MAFRYRLTFYFILALAFFHLSSLSLCMFGLPLFNLRYPHSLTLFRSLFPHANRYPNAFDTPRADFPAENLLQKKKPRLLMIIPWQVLDYLVHNNFRLLQLQPR